MSGLWGPQSTLDLYLQEEGITTLLFAGVNADQVSAHSRPFLSTAPAFADIDISQCVLGTLVDSYYRGYDCVLISDAVATTSPEGAYENVLYNALHVRPLNLNAFQSCRKSLTSCYPKGIRLRDGQQQDRVRSYGC